jgi:hypothetical protein
MAEREFNTDHEKHLRQAMDELISSGVEGGFVVFETDGDKSIEFSYSHQDGLTLDLPLLGLTDEEKARVGMIEGLEGVTDTDVSKQLQVGLDTRIGARIAHRVFREVFRCKEKYPVRVTLDI